MQNIKIRNKLKKMLEICLDLQAKSDFWPEIYQDVDTYPACYLLNICM